MQDTQTPLTNPIDAPAYYEVYADGRRIYSGHDWIASILACCDAGRLYGAQQVERWVDGHLYARLTTHL